MSLVAISSLDPSQPVPSVSAFKALVTLLWPFSSSNGQCALLLADPDFRKRYQKGQVRVRFAGPCAKAIGSSKVGIGDEIELDLSGARWTSEDTDGALVKTPGNGLQGELIFERNLKLVIRRNGQEEQVVFVDEATTAREAAIASETPSTPVPRLRKSLLGMDDFGVAVYSSPAFMKRLRLSEGSAFQSPYTPVSDDGDLDTELSRKRRRVSYKNVSEWKFDTREPSPEKQDVDVSVAEPGTDANRDDAERAGQQNDNELSTNFSVAPENARPHEEDATMKDATPEAVNISQEPQAAEIANTGGKTSELTAGHEGELERAVVSPEQANVQTALSTDLPRTNVGATEDDAPIPQDFELQDEKQEERTPNGEDKESNEEEGYEDVQSASSKSASMPPPSLPRLEIPLPPPTIGLSPIDGTTRDESHDPLTPRLHPVANQNLPLPSPFPTSAEMLAAISPKGTQIASSTNITIGPTTESEPNVAVERDQQPEAGVEDLPTVHEPPDIEVVELDSSDDDADEHLHIVTGVAEKSMSPISEAQRLAIDSISVASMGDESSIARSSVAPEELPTSPISKTPEVPRKSAEALPRQENNPGQSMPDTNDPMELVPSSPARDNEEPPKATTQEALDQNMDIATEELQAPEQARSPSQGSEADISSEADYDEDELADLQIGSEGSEEGEEPDFDMLTDEFKKQHDIDEQDLQDMLEEESSSDDEVVHESDPEDSESEDIGELIEDRSDDDTGYEDEDGKDDEDLESAVLPQAWDKEEEISSEEGQSDAQSFASQVTPVSPRKQSSNPFGLDGSGTSKVAEEDVVKLIVQPEDDEEAAWRARDEALHALGDRQPPAPFHAALKLSEPGELEKGSRTAPSQRARPKLAVVEMLSDSEEEVSQAPNPDGQLKEQDDAMIPQPESETASLLLPPAETSLTSDNSNKEAQEEQLKNVLQHPVASAAAEDDDDLAISPVQSPLIIDTEKRTSTLSRSDGDRATERVHKDHAMMDDSQQLQEEASPPIETIDVGMEPSVEVGSQTLDIPQTVGMDIVAPVSEPASESAPQDVDDAQRLTSSSFMTLSSSSPGPRQQTPVVAPIEELDLSQVEPDYWMTASLSQFTGNLTGTQRTEPVPDSAGSPVTTLYPGSSRQTSRAPTPSNEERILSSAEGPPHNSLMDLSQTLSGSPLRTFVSAALSQEEPSKNARSVRNLSSDKQHESTVDDDELLADYVEITPEPAVDAGRPFEIAAEKDASEKVASEEHGSGRENAVDADGNMLSATEMQGSEGGRAEEGKDERAVPSPQHAELFKRAETKSNGADDTVIEPTFSSPETAEQDTATFSTTAHEELQPTPRTSSSEILAEDQAAVKVAVTEGGGTQAILSPPPPPEPFDNKEAQAAPSSESRGEVLFSPDPTLAATSLDKKAGARSGRIAPETPVGKASTPGPRKSMASRMSGVPSIISAWFTPRQSSGGSTAPKGESAAHTPTKAPSTAPPKLRQGKARERSISPPPFGRLATQGTTTSLAYFHPLTAISEYLNQPSTSVDIIAISVGSSRAPAKAQKGPRDFFTVLYIRDPALNEHNKLKNDEAPEEPDKVGNGTGHDMRVEIYRPWKASLPSTDAGDVIMLRNFVVKSHERREYLLSSKSSSWCVWRFSASASQEVEAEAGDIFKPAWARRRRASVKEEIRGPPMDIGVEERQKASELRKWWEELQSAKTAEATKDMGKEAEAENNEDGDQDDEMTG